MRISTLVLSANHIFTTQILAGRTFARLIFEGRTSRDTKVNEVMSAPVVAVDPTTTVEEAMALMTDRRIRHAPVVDDGDLAGMISIGDLVRVMSKQQDYKIQYLTEYITAR